MAKYPARDLVLKIGATTIGQCTAIGMVGSTRELIDASAYGDDWKDYVSGQQDGSEVELTIHMDPADAGQDALAAAYDAGTSSTFDLSHADSAYGDDWKDYVSGQQDGSEVEVSLAMDPLDAGQDALAAAYDAGTSSTFDLSHADSTFHVTFPALVTSYQRGGERDGVLAATATLKILNPGVTDV